MTEPEILGWLREEDPAHLDALFQEADRVRRERVGDAIHLRGLIEISNRCSRSCLYCGMRAGNRSLERYRLTPEEILECAVLAVEFGYGSVVLQGGEDATLDIEALAETLRAIRSRTGLAITLSLGEQSDEILRRWKEAGADRYLLRFETTDRALFERIHPPSPHFARDRFEQLEAMRRIGYEVGSGVMIGIPGQSYESLAHDIARFAELDLDMIGVGPFLPHPETPLGRPGEAERLRLPPGVQVPNTESMTGKVLALTRLTCPDANIPATTALATLAGTEGRERGLGRGANVIMPNLSPREQRAKYEIYPDKAGKHETAEETNRWVRTRIAAIGRAVGVGPGGRRRPV